jgi:hypothetical protein
MTARARRTGVFAGALLLCAGAFAAVTPRPLPSLREQAEIQQQWLKLRLERVLPGLMRRHGVQMWLVISREYNEDPVFFSLMPPTTMAARRRTILVFNDLGIDKGVSASRSAAAARSTGNTGRPTPRAARSSATSSGCCCAS